MNALSKAFGAMTPRRWVTALVTVLAVTSAVLLGVGLSRQAPAPPQVAPAASAPESGRAPHGSEGTKSPAPQTDETPSAAGDSGPEADPGAAAALPASRPERIEIPAIGVSSPLVTLGLGPDGAMETPKDPAKAGWYEPGPAPGSDGPAVIAGHVTWNGAESVFFDLAKLKPGDEIDVTRKDGRTAVFTVDRVKEFPKNDFPTIDVYHNLDHPGLRLITCGGDYSSSKHYYDANVVVFAAMTSSHR